MKKIEIPEGYTARIDGNKVILEPKDSKDEKIRRAISAAICGTAAISVLEANGANLPDALFYLEKQKEQKPAEWSGLTNKNLAVETLRDVADALKEHNLYPGLQESLIDLAYDIEHMHILQPAEWSEEDEGMLNCIIATLCEESHGGREANHKMVTWLDNRLKSLRPQPKVELTLLDENIINAAVAFVEQNDHFNCWAGIDKLTVITALRSLKPHWRPSKAQINALKLVARGYPADDLDAIESLLNDLQKL